MKIEIWSDFTCPYCYIGKRRLDLAIEQFGRKEYIDIEYKSYELDPSAENGSCRKHDMFMQQHQLQADEVAELFEQISHQAREIGLDLRLENIVHTNTFHAHRLVKHACKQGIGELFVERLFELYFVREQNIGERDVLLALAEELGFDRGEADELLCLNKHSKKVRHEEELAAELGITGVPFFIFNETYAISGAQPIEVYLDLLEEVWEEEKKPVVHAKRAEAQVCKGSYCIGDECETQ